VLKAATVGYLGVLPGPTLGELADVRFVDEQKRQFLLIAGAFVLFIAVLAFPLSSALTARVRAVAAGARELAAGNYEARVGVSSHDELGRLASDFNDLAAALQRTERGRREWVADISHELRTPLSTMRAEIEALQDGIRPLSAEAVDALHLDVMRLGRLVDDLYDLSRSDLGALSYNKQSLDPCAVLRADLQALSAQFDKRRIAVEMKAADGLQVHGDAGRLSQLFRNLLTNSLRYTDVDGRLTIDVVRKGNEVLFSFEDSAPGVPEADLQHLLQRFHRVERSRSRDTGGAGLGLAICASIAAAHGGRIDVRRGRLGGLGVQVSLPLD
jgi:two-component system sensor histidine kinase BaeS